MALIHVDPCRQCHRRAWVTPAQIIVRLKPDELDNIGDAAYEYYCPNPACGHFGIYPLASGTVLRLQVAGVRIVIGDEAATPERNLTDEEVESFIRQIERSDDERMFIELEENEE